MAIRNIKPIIYPKYCLILPSSSDSATWICSRPPAPRLLLTPARRRPPSRWPPCLLQSHQNLYWLYRRIGGPVGGCWARRVVRLMFEDAQVLRCCWWRCMFRPGGCSPLSSWRPKLQGCQQWFLRFPYLGRGGWGRHSRCSWCSCPKQIVFPKLWRFWRFLGESSWCVWVRYQWCCWGRGVPFCCRQWSYQQSWCLRWWPGWREWRSLARSRRRSRSCRSLRLQWGSIRWSIWQRRQYHWNSRIVLCWPCNDY